MRLSHIWSLEIRHRLLGPPDLGSQVQEKRSLPRLGYGSMSSSNEYSESRDVEHDRECLEGKKYLFSTNAKYGLDWYDNPTVLFPIQLRHLFRIHGLKDIRVLS